MESTRKTLEEVDNKKINNILEFYSDNKESDNYLLAEEVLRLRRQNSYLKGNIKSYLTKQRKLEGIRD